MDNGNEQCPRNIGIGIDAHIQKNLLRECGTEFDLKTAHFSALADIHLKFSVNLKRNLDTVIKMAILTITLGDIKGEFNIFCQFKSVSNAIRPNLFLGELDTVFVIHDNLIILDVIQKFLAVRYHSGQILHRFLGKIRLFDLLHDLLFQRTRIDIFKHGIAINPV